MRAAAIVKIEIPPDRGACVRHAVVGVQIDLLVLHRPPEPFDEHVVPPRALAVHADRDLILDEHACEGCPREMVAAGYGDTNWLTFQGAGGLSGAMPDLARLVSIFTGHHDHHVLKRSTIKSMLDKAAATFIRFSGNRAGYGLDTVTGPTDGPYYGLKGGEINNAAGVLNFNGPWGFALCFGSPAQVPGSWPVWISQLHADDDHRPERVLAIHRPVPGVRDAIAVGVLLPTARRRSRGEHAFCACRQLGGVSKG